MMRAILAAILLLAMAVPAHAQITPGTTWYWQLQGTINMSQKAKVYDIDMEQTSAATIAKLKAAGHTVVCYFSAGTYEAYRTDAKAFPKAIIGKKLDDWSDVYIDIRSPLVRPIMSARMDAAKAKGCDGLEPDVMDAWQADSGFPITQADQTTYAKWIASYAHSKGLLVALKNAVELVPAVVSDFDFVIAESCFDYNECGGYSPFINAGKAVLAAEYTRQVKAAWCSKAKTLHLSLAFYGQLLDGKRFATCP